MTVKVAIVGSRNYKHIERIGVRIGQLVKEYGAQNITIISGGAKGPDSIAVSYAIRKGIRITVYPANWNRYAKRAGPIRNTTIVNNADRIIAFWDGRSRGTRDTIDKAHLKQVPIEVILDENTGE